MNTITPLMRAILEALDVADDGLTDNEVRAKIDASVSNDDLALALYELFYDLELTKQLFLIAEDEFEAETLHEITGAGCDALWALQKAEAQARSRLRDYDASIPMRDGDVLPRVGAPAVHFESRAAMRAYLSGAQA